MIILSQNMKLAAKISSNKLKLLLSFSVFMLLYTAMCNILFQSFSNPLTQVYVTVPLFLRTASKRCILAAAAFQVFWAFRKCTRHTSKQLYLFLGSQQLPISFLVPFQVLSERVSALGSCLPLSSSHRCSVPELLPSPTSIWQ